MVGNEVTGEKMKSHGRKGSRSHDRERGHMTGKVI